MNILDLIRQDGHELKRKATTNGGEYAGPCPDCGGDDRFLVWPEYRGGRYWCRQCKKSGDTIQYLREFRGMGYREACKYLSIVPKKPTLHGFTCQSQPLRERFVPRSNTNPNDTWMNQAEIFMQHCQRNLWSQSGEEGQRLLKGKGLGEEIIKNAGLGYNPVDRYINRQEWGLPKEIKPDGKSKILWLPRGIVTPHYHEGKVIRLRIRRQNPADGPRYVTASGSNTRPMVFTSGKEVVFVVESDLDGLLLNQEVGDLIDLVVLGALATRPDVIAHQRLLEAAMILVSLDSDGPGAKEAWQFWPHAYGGKVQRWPCINGKDPSEAWGNGLNIRSWVSVGLNCRYNKNVVGHDEMQRPHEARH